MVLILLRRVPSSCARSAAVSAGLPLPIVRGTLQTRACTTTTSTAVTTTMSRLRPSDDSPSALPRCMGSTTVDRPLFGWSIPYPTHANTGPHQQQGRRGYVSRAHPTVATPLGLHTALRNVLDDVNVRNSRRQRKANRNQKESATLMDETVELALNLNLDPRKPNQALRGSIELPSGSGKFVNCLVFTGDAAAVEQIKEKAAASSSSSSKIEVGGEDLVDKIASGLVNVDQFQRGLGTADMQSMLTKRLARVLGPRGLMPNAKTGTLLDTPSALSSALETQLAGTIIQYRTDREGIVHVRVGRASFGPQRLLDNVGAVAREIFRAKPDAYGKGKKSSKNAKYLLGASLTSTQGKGYKLDPRTLDPSSPFFLNWIEGEEEAFQEGDDDGADGSAETEAA